MRCSQCHNSRSSPVLLAKGVRGKHIDNCPTCLDPTTCPAINHPSYWKKAHRDTLKERKRKFNEDDIPDDVKSLVDEPKNGGIKEFRRIKTALNIRAKRIEEDMPDPDSEPRQPEPELDLEPEPEPEPELEPAEPEREPEPETDVAETSAGNNLAIRQFNENFYVKNSWELKRLHEKLVDAERQLLKTQSSRYAYDYYDARSLVASLHVSIKKGEWLLQELAIRAMARQFRACTDIEKDITLWLASIDDLLYPNPVQFSSHSTVSSSSESKSNYPSSQSNSNYTQYSSPYTASTSSSSLPSSSNSASTLSASSYSSSSSSSSYSPSSSSSYSPSPSSSSTDMSDAQENIAPSSKTRPFSSSRVV